MVCFADYLLNLKRGWALFTQDVAVSAFSRLNWAQMPFLSRLQACRILPFTDLLSLLLFHLNNNEIKRLAAQHLTNSRVTRNYAAKVHQAGRL